VGTGQHARSGLTEVLWSACGPGDTLIVRRVGRIGRRTGELIQLVADPAVRDIGVRSLTAPIDTTTPATVSWLDAIQGRKRQEVFSTFRRINGIGAFDSTAEDAWLARVP